MMICSEQIKILVEPEFGGRITNLSRILGQEWLAPAHAPLVARAVGAVYIRPEMGVGMKCVRRPINVLVLMAGNCPIMAKLGAGHGR